MSQEPVQDMSALATELLVLMPQIVRRLNADVPLEGEASEGGADLHDIAELRATPGQLSLLRILVERDRCMMQELAEQLAVTPSTVTAMVKRLLAQGYVERARDDVDWRAVWITLTARGRQVFAAYNRIQLESLRKRLEQLSEDDRQKLASALTALRHLIGVDA